ncbi:MAG: tRNA 2-selenouridine(34) synthase MnmH [Ezakiella sp.]|nr:tRNA 2-selenouridine(34) synthase MnmH [Ezakiella sp.]MDD7472300.1 tRNA 2-selenouridine(34) synthase MnmH [Bacillota bacterium]MDY3923037.1 tRNA 2-selenouridine(34) synthase MnmH [Ezakiella sp.]
MFYEIELNEIINSDMLIDLRSEIEYENFHFPRAISFPILNTEERKIVGTLYDQGKTREAKKNAIIFGAPKLSNLEELVNSSEGSRVIFYCARGGYRSKTITSIFSALGYNVFKLKGGIKAYRHYINNNLNKKIENVDLITIYGNTGSGKTEIIHALNAANYPIIDLENLANHMGSSLGSVGIGTPNSQKMFDCLMFNAIRDEKTLYFCEGESKRIGNSIIPDKFYEKMLKSKKVYLETPLTDRVERLVKTYAKDGVIDELIASIDKLQKYIGVETFKNIKSSIEKKDYYKAAELLCVKYYDHNYRFNPNEDTIVIKNTNPENTVEELKNIYINLQNSSK